MRRYRVNVIKRVRRNFADDVVCAVQVGLNGAPVTRSKQSSLDPFAQVGLVLAYVLTIQETAFAGVTLLVQGHANAHAFGFVSEHLDEASMRNTHKVLIGAFA